MPATQQPSTRYVSSIVERAISEQVPLWSPAVSNADVIRQLTWSVRHALKFEPYSALRAVILGM